MYNLLFKRRIPDTFHSRNEEAEIEYTHAIQVEYGKRHSKGH